MSEKSGIKRFIKNNWIVILTGVIIGVLAPLLVKLGNPGNMGICTACFTRDITGALGFFRIEKLSYIRPEIIGIILGSTVSALAFKEFKARGGSSPMIRFMLGMFAMIGALVFLGCPWRAYLRLSGGDWTSIFGLIGLVGGILVGILFLKNGFSLGRNYKSKPFSAWIMPLVALGLLALLLFNPKFGSDGAGPIFQAIKGHAPLLISLGVGLVIGILAQRSRFCTIGGVRDSIMLKDFHLLWGIIAFVIVAFITNLTLGQFNPGFVGQPAAHNDIIWNIGGMLLAGLAFVLAGGCPGRMLVLSGEGDNSAGMFVFGMVAGAGVAHNFSLASSGAGVSAFGPIAVIIGIIFTILVGFTMRERIV